MGTLKDLLEDEANEVFLECSVKNWDGYDAEPISKETYKNFLELLKQISDDYLIPSIAADPRGCISLEFYKKNKYVLSLAVDENAEVNYAVFIDNFKEHGKESLTHLIRIKEILNKYFTR